MVEITLEEQQGRRLLQREKELGLDGPVRIALNLGTYRSEEKRAMLRRLRELDSPFRANIGD